VTRSDKIVQREGQWCAVSADGSRSFGCYDTRAEAAERLRQVEAAKAAKGDSVTRVDFLGHIRVVEDSEIELELEPDEFAARLTPEGYLEIRGRVSGIGVYEYESEDGDRWGGLRVPEEVFAKESLASFAMRPVTNDHPSEMVTADNIAKYQRGQLGSDAARDGDYVLASMLITSPDLIEKIKSGKTQLSCGYETIVVEEKGLFNGKPYDYRQTNSQINHVSVVDLARGGDECRLLFDSAGAFSRRRPQKDAGDSHSNSKEDNTMKFKITKDGKLVIGEQEHEVPDAVAEAFKALQAKVEEQGAELSKLSAEGDQEGEDPMDQEGEEMESKDSNSILKVLEDAFQAKAKAKAKAKEDTKPVSVEELQAKVDTLTAQLAEQRSQVSHNIDARVRLVTTARDICGPELVTDGVSDIGLMKAVICKVTPAMKTKLMDSKDPVSDDYVRGSYEIALDTHTRSKDSSRELLSLTHQALKGDAEVDLDALYKTSKDAISKRARSQKEIH